MTALVAVLQLQGAPDWQGFAVVMGILGLCLLLCWADVRASWLDGDLDLQGIVDRTLEPDHVTCEHPGCDLVLCYCRGPRCPAAVEPGCHHTGGFVCEEHRFEECEGCREDHRHDVLEGVAW